MSKDMEFRRFGGPVRILKLAQVWALTNGAHEVEVIVRITGKGEPEEFKSNTCSSCESKPVESGEVLCADCKESLNSVYGHVLNSDSHEESETGDQLE